MRTQGEILLRVASLTPVFVCEMNQWSIVFLPTNAQRCRSETGKNYFKGSLYFSIVTIKQKITSWKPEL